MEDAHVATGSLGAGDSDWKNVGMFAVFDGHGGSQTAKHCAKAFPKAIAKGKASKAEETLRKAFFAVDQELARNAVHDEIGSTSVVCLVTPQSVVVGNAGDSRAVLSRNGRAVDLSLDHKPNLREEKARIKAAGGLVEENDGYRVTHKDVPVHLAVSRAMGDHCFKKNPRLRPEQQLVSCEPDMEEQKRRAGDEFMVIACDGVWDVMTSQEVVDLVRRFLPCIQRGETKPHDVVGMILDKCLRLESQDNMTMILVVFEQGSSPAADNRPAARASSRGAGLRANVASRSPPPAGNRASSRTKRGFPPADQSFNLRAAQHGQAFDMRPAGLPSNAEPQRTCIDGFRRRVGDAIASTCAGRR